MQYNQGNGVKKNQMYNKSHFEPERYYTSTCNFGSKKNSINFAEI
jgi:hypothetical protein